MASEEEEEEEEEAINGGLSLSLSSSSSPEDLPPSPKNKFKFLCSHGGRILPRPADGHLKYVGGETRVIAVPRHISFSELNKRLSDMIKEGDNNNNNNNNNNMVLKYQLGFEDLDALVSIRTDEDLKHMLDEYDRQLETIEGSPKLRIFLFPSSPQQQHSTIDSHNNNNNNNSIEQRYIDAINGVVRINKTNKQQQQPPNIVTTFTISACSSPNSNSPDFQAINEGHEIMFSSNNCNNLHRVQSSPSLYRSNSPQWINSGYIPQAYHYGLPQQNYLLDLQKAAASERLAPALSMARGEFRRGVFGHGGGGVVRHDFCGYGTNNFHGIDHRDDVSHPKSPRKKFWE
ncbi:uncharacterized protein LOC115721418 [Cannabis sativa]|uniref:uncharacterized protein LOC115721418 n=1 Tax=Cannabis sativa TaxID=3483 RepID=UPI0029CA6406|nr:uncharacterized protein LOC115721418 [Cannabis sativa]